MTTLQLFPTDKFSELSREELEKSDEWYTPDSFWLPLHRRFGFQWDAAATRASSKCGPGRCWTIDDDALAQEWRPDLGPFWTNPPYSRGNVERFMAKARDAALRLRSTVVLLVPARTDTQWFHRSVLDPAGLGRRLLLDMPRPETILRVYERLAIEHTFVEGRIAFNHATGKTEGDGAKFANLLVAFSPEPIAQEPVAQSSAPTTEGAA